MNTKTSYKTVANNISLTGGKYRCRIMKNGKRYQTYTTNLKNARKWINGVKNGTISLKTTQLLKG